MKIAHQIVRSHWIAFGISWATSVFLLNGCQGFLEKEPLDVYSVSSFYQNQTQAEQAVNGVYASFYADGMWRRNMWIAQEVGTDNGYFEGSNSFDDYSLNPTNGDAGTIYRDHWRGIVRAQFVIDKLPGVKMDDNLRLQYEAEVRFLNALLYFNLVRLFGDVPVIREIPSYESSFRVARTPVKQVYEQIIIPDLKFSAEQLPLAQTDKGRATKGAAQALLAKVHLTRGDYEKVIPLTEAIMQSGQYGLEANYGDNFKLSNENGKESLFEIQYSNEYNYGGQQWQFWNPGGWGFRVTDDLVKAYKTIRHSPADSLPDTRRIANLIIPGDSVPETGYKHPQTATYNLARKYATLKADQVAWLSQPINDKVLRYADVLLMHAEAENMVNGPAGAYKYINQVRRRAYGVDISTANELVDLKDLSQAALDAAILAERQLEFALESQRWFDLIRKGKAIEVLSAHKNTNTTTAKTITETDLLFPIPQGEIDINPNISQNPGY